MITFAEARREAWMFGCALTKKDGEYRVCPINGTEEQAYYTNDLDDACGTAHDMYIHRKAGSD